MHVSILASLLALLIAPFHHEAPPLKPLAVDAIGWTYADTRSPIRLVGLNIDTYIFEDGRIPPPWFVTNADFENLAKWGANSFRLNMDYRWFISSDLKKINPRGWEYLDWVIAEAERNRLYAILDMHIPVGGMQVGGRVTRLWSDENLQRVFIELWQQIAERYKDSPVIAGYYLIGEPTPKRGKQWQGLAQKTLDAIREVSPRQVVIVEAPNSGDGDLKQLKPLEGDNVMYAWQLYEPFPFTHQGASWEEPGAFQAENVTYPGQIIEEFKTLRTDHLPAADAASPAAEEAANPPAEAPDNGWTQLTSAPLVAPENATHLTLRLHAPAGTGKICFDDLQVLEDGKPMALLNPGFEDARLIEERADKMPDFWHVSGARKSVKWESAGAHSGKHCIAFLDSDKTVAIRQALNSETGLYPVKPGSTYVFSMWVKGTRAAKSAAEKPFGMEIRWNRAEGQYWGPKELESAIYQNLVAWSRKYQAPVYVPEFAASAQAPNRCDLIWTRDVLTILDKYGLSWHLWDFRDIRGPKENINHIMGLYDGPEGMDSSQCTLDAPLLNVLKPAFKRAN